MNKSHLHFTKWQDIPVGALLETSWEKSNYWEKKQKGLQDFNFNCDDFWNEMESNYTFCLDEKKDYCEALKAWSEDVWNTDFCNFEN